MNEQILIKHLGPKCGNIALVTCEGDIPEILKETGSVTAAESGMMNLACVRGRQTVSYGNYISWEKSDETGTGYTVKCKYNVRDSIDILDGQYYERTNPIFAQVVDFDAPVPDFMSGANIEHGPAGEIILRAEWGEMYAPRGADFMYLAYSDGSYGLLDLKSKEASQYYMCDNTGRITGQKLISWLESTEK